MICSNCQKPYSFVDKNDFRFFVCLECKHKEPYITPEYENYHDELYRDNSYRRTIDTDPQMKYIFKKLAIKPKNIILDIGCGVGDYAEAVYKEFSKNIIGLDLSVQAARKKYPNLNFIEYNGDDPLPLDDSSVDIVISINCVEHVYNYNNLLSECRRVLKTGGCIAMTTANLDFFLHNYFYDKTHLHEWTLEEFTSMTGKYFSLDVAQKSSSMFKYYPLNFIATKFLKPDLLIIGKKE